MTFQVNKVGVIGAGTMGGGIAAHLANIGIPVVLLDIPTPNLSDEEKESPAARNRLVDGLFKRMTKSKPASLGRKDRANLIDVGNTEDDFAQLAECDLIIEAIIERLDLKKALMQRLSETVADHTIIASNTSGIPISQIVEDCSDDIKGRFIGMHFFNPARYLKLLEIIPTGDTSQETIDAVADFGRNTLGKGVVICKDTPNFIGNRFFSITGAYASEYALQNGYGISETDSLCGPLIGRPKTGIFRLVDLVGLDVMDHVNRNLYPAIGHDNFREALKGEKSNRVNDFLMEKRWLGNKSGQGFYKKDKQNGKRVFLTLDPETLEYALEPKARFESVGKVRKIEDLGERLRKLLEFDDKAANFVREITYYNLSYASHVTPEIAYSVMDVDNAVKWGFAHEAGPFEIWDMLGVADTIQKMEASGYSVADWVKEMIASGVETFYGADGYYDFSASQVAAHPTDKNIVYVKDLYADNKVVEQNGSASLLDMGDGVLLYEFHSKMNAIDGDMGDIGRLGLERLNTDFDAMVMGNNGQDFCVGANIGMVGIAAAQGKWDMIDDMLKDLHQLVMALRHAPKPVVTAPHQRVLGGGVEMAMAGWATVADHETYMGLVEVGVGLIPAGGGLKEVVARKINPVMETANADVLPVMQEVFTNIATAKVGTSAWEDRTLGYLRDEDTLVFNSDHRLAKAKQVALKLVETGAAPPEEKPVYAAGRDVYTALKLGLQSFAWGGFASAHDALIGEKLAYALCGGDLSQGTWVSPWHILDLEREGFLSLCGEKKTQERIMHMLQTGKPLRN